MAKNDKLSLEMSMYAFQDKMADFWEDETGDDVLYVNRNFFKCYPLQDWMDTFEVTKIVIMDDWDIRFHDDDDEFVALMFSKAQEKIGF